MIYILIFILSVFNLDTIYSYIIFFVLGIIVALLAIRHKASINNSKINLCVIGILAMWLYGVILGIFRGNTLPFVIRNFAGLVLYITFFLLKFTKADCQKLIKTIFLAALFVLCLFVVCVPIVTNLNEERYYGDLLNWLLGDAIIQNMQDSLMIRFPTESTLFPLASISLYHVLYEKKKVIASFLFAISSIAIILCDSGGYTLAYGVLMFFFVFGFLMRRKKVTRYVSVASVIVAAIILVVFFRFPNPVSYILQVFSTQDAGNAIRFNQIVSVTKEISILGKGLGATFETVNQTKEFPYAIEVIYLNIFHKFGITAMIYMTSLLYTYVRCLKSIYLNQNAFEAHVCLGLMSYSIIALGNPVLFAPQNVIFHCIVLYLLDNSDKKLLQEEKHYAI